MLVWALLLICSIAQADSVRPLQATPLGRIAFVRAGNLWLWEAGRERQVTKTGKDASPLFSSSGRYVAFRRESELWVAQVEGKGLWRVAEAVMGAGDWAPREDAIAYSTEAGTFTVSMSATGPQEPRLLVKDWGQPVWSPDGAVLALVRTTYGAKQFTGTTSIGLLPPSGGEPRVMLQEEYPHESACGPVGGVGRVRWSADGRWLSYFRCGLFASLSADCGELSVMPSEGGRPTPVAVVPSNTAWFRWRPTGAVLAFVDGAGRGAWWNKSLRLAEMPPAQPFASLTPSGYADRDPSWSLDGSRLAFTRSLAKWPEKMTLPAPEQAVWVVRLSEGRPEVVPGSENGFAPQWGPGQSLAWFQGVGGEQGSLWYVEQPGRAKRQLVDGIDLPFPYYGEWDLALVFDWWNAFSIASPTGHAALTR